MQYQARPPPKAEHSKNLIEKRRKKNMTPFVSCPVDVFRAQVSPTAYKVFLVLKSFDNKEHKIFPS